MVVLYQVRKELQEEGHDQQANVHAVNIGVGGYHNPVKSQAIHSFFDIQACCKRFSSSFS
jgi:hypothetical protein